MKLRSIQVLRAIAVLGVALFHTTGDWLTVGSAGVDLFFVISGFIIASISAGRQRVRFAADRLWRIFPLYLICLATFSLIAPPDRSLCGDVVSLTLLPLGCEPYLRPAWTLIFELIFYAVATLCIGYPRLLPVAIVALVGAGSILPLGQIGDPMLLEFLAGVLIARLPRSRSIAPLLIAASVAIFALAPDMNGSALRFLWWGVPSALMVYGCLSLEPAFKSRGFDALVRIGDASYSIYLTHFIVLFSLPAIYPAMLPLNMALIVAVGCLVHLLVERPLLALKPARTRAADRPQTAKPTGDVVPTLQ